MIDCLIIDDEPVARNIIRAYCSHLPVLNIVAECGNAIEAREILQTQTIDLLFLDIHMPVLSGTGFLSTIKKPPQVIFTTAFQEYAVNAFELAACDYLLKPFSLERFMIAIDKAKERILQNTVPPTTNNFPSQNDGLFIKAGGKLSKVLFRECLYAEAQGNYTSVITLTTSILTKVPFSTFMVSLPSALFVQVHRSFIINKTLIRHIEGNRVFIRDKEVPVATAYRDNLFKELGLLNRK
jgi:DNA-binding LytR/AlgR family response regulator